MSITFQECVNKLLAGNGLEWEKHGNHAAGQTSLNTAGARRLFFYLISQNPDTVVRGDEVLFPGLIDAWEDDERDPKDDAISFSSILGEVGFRLAKIETEGFGGVNLFAGPHFYLNVARQSWCLEGQNGSGKTALVSAIIWGLTGRRVREQSGLVLDEGSRSPVYDAHGNKIGSWPPLASYPTQTDSLNQDVRVRVKLTFIDNANNEAVAERTIISKSDGTTQTETNLVDPRLLSAPQLLESGVLMPSRIAHINFGEKSQTLYEAVKALTGLDQLGAIGDGAANLTHGARRFLKYAKDHGVQRIEADYKKHIKAAVDHANIIDLDLSKISEINGEETVENLESLITVLSKTATEYTETLTAVVAGHIDLSQPEGRKEVSDAVGVGKDVAKRASENVVAFSVLKELFVAKGEGLLDTLPMVISNAEGELTTALKWHARQQTDLKLRLKALASQWYVEPDSPEDLANCPLCESDLQTPEQKELQNQLQDLKAAGEAAERLLEDVCRNIRDYLTSTLPKGLRQHIDTLGKMEPKANIVNSATQLFSATPPFSDILTGAGGVMKEVIATQALALPVFEAAVQLRVVEGDPSSAASLRKFLYELQFILELGDWWAANRSEFVKFWKDIVDFMPEGEKPSVNTVFGQIAIIENALAASQPYDAILALLDELLESARSWREINVEQKKREEIANALVPLKSLRIFVDSETARSIAGLSGRMKDFLDKIHLKERLEFQDADLKKKEIHVHGAFAEGMKFDALPIANTSWLKAILWAFIFALREKSIESYGGNPFPLMLLDDPQTTFDPRNKRKWAQELSRLTNLSEDETGAVQLFLTTHERQFFTWLTEVEGMKGQEGLIAQADEAQGCITIVNGNILEREYDEAVARRDDGMARSYIRQARIYVEKLLKYVLRGEGPRIVDSNLDAMRRELIRLSQADAVPFNRKPFEELLKVLNGGERGIRLINNPPHDDDETIGVAEATDVHNFWESTLKKRIHNAFHAYATFEAHYGDPRTFDYPENIVRLPTGQHEEISNVELFQTGLVAAAMTDGRVGDGFLRVEEWENAERVTLFNHEILRLTANTMEPVASFGNMVIVSNFANIERNHLVVAAVGDRLLARRLQESELHPDLAILTAQAVNPDDLAAPEIVPIEGLAMSKIVGTLFTASVGTGASASELEAVEDTQEFLSVLNQARLFKVQGRSAEPIALDEQFLMVGQPVDDSALWGAFEGRLVIGVDIDGHSYFKRLRSPRGGLYVMESLNPDGTTPAELLSVDGREGVPQLVQVLPVLGVLFELPTES
jgi:hypothetical protein